MTAVATTALPWLIVRRWPSWAPRAEPKLTTTKAFCGPTLSTVERPARLVKTAILTRESGREGVREALEDAGLSEVPRLEEHLNVLATIAQVAPLLGLLGTVLGFLDIFAVLQGHGPFANSKALAGGVLQAMTCTATGLGVAIPAYMGYNFLVSRVNAIVFDMERVSTEILNLVTPLGSKS